MLQTYNFTFVNLLAMAPQQGESGGGGLMGFLPMILIFVAFYFLLIAPQRKKQKQHQKMINALEKGDNVKTIGGVFGTVTGVKVDRVIVRIAENVKVEVAKDAVSAKVD